jgi:hypothetical protein
MPLVTKELHGGNDESNVYCVHCTDSSGKLKSKEEVREGMIKFFMNRKKKSREDAEKFVDDYMSQMPAWKQ